MLSPSNLALGLRQQIALAISALPEGITEWPLERIASLLWVEGPWTDSEVAQITDKSGVLWEVMRDEAYTNESGYMIPIWWQSSIDRDTGDVFVSPMYDGMTVLTRNEQEPRTLGSLFVAMGYPDRVRLLTFGPLTPRHDGFGLRDPLQNIRPNLSWPSQEAATPMPV